MKKKIYIVTWFSARNYGTCLQAAALYKYLENLGYNVFYAKRGSKYGFINKCVSIFRRGVNNIKGCVSASDYKRFLFLRGFKIKRISSGVLRKDDCCLAGSDQIWNTYYNYSPFYFLDFAEDRGKRVSYASSIGTNGVKEEYKAVVKKHLLKFDSIGVRERTAVCALSELTGRRDIVQVLDPTFLLTSYDWGVLCNEAVIEMELPSRYMLCYVLGENIMYKKNLEDIRDKIGIKSIVLVRSCENSKFQFDNDAIDYKYAGPLEFVYLLRHAEVVCTDSFHATALSINNCVNFVELVRFEDDDIKSQNYRIYDLLTDFGLNDRLYNSNNLSWRREIDWNRVTETLEQKRKFSSDFLIKAIES